jgi:hypothetical protein
MNVVLGPIVGAHVTIMALDDRNQVIAEGQTRDDDQLFASGGISVVIPKEYEDTPLYVRISGGIDIDADDDGIRDQEPTVNNTDLEFVVPNAEALNNLQMNTVFNPLLLFASQYVLENIYQGYEVTVENVTTVLRRVARALIVEDVDGDGQIGWEDIVCFHPLVDQHKSRIPWEYVINSIERNRADYYAGLELHYAKSYYLDPGTEGRPQPYDWDGSGTWKDDPLLDYHDASFVIQFRTNKNGYTIQDFIDGQEGELRGGSVAFPDNALVSYYYGYPCGDDGFYGEEHGVSSVPLDTRCAQVDGSLSVQVGGNMVSPENAPTGAYQVNYRTGDNQEHQEVLYVFENSENADFFVIPELTIDAHGRIEKFKLRFEDAEGTILDDPPFLSGSFNFQLWGTISQVNQQVRGDGFYTIPFQGSSEEVERGIYQAQVDLVNPTAEYIP